MNIRNADWTLQPLVDTCLVYQLLILATDFFKLNCHVLHRLCVLALVEDAKATLAQLLLNIVPICDYYLHRILWSFLLPCSINGHAEEILFQNYSGCALNFVS